MNKAVFLACALCAGPAVFAAVSPAVEATQVVSAPEDRYCGWPTITRTAADELTVMFSGNRDGHVCPYGQIRRIRSTDGGRTWSKSEIVENGILDDRDTGVLRLANGDLVLFWFTSTAFYDYYKRWEKDLAQRKKTYPYLSNLRAEYETHYKTLDPEAVRTALGAFAKRSTDGGKTWGDKVKLPFESTHTPHGAIELKDGRLMFVGDDRRVAVSSDKGRTWSVLAQMPSPSKVKPGERKLGFTEPCLLEGEDGVLRCYIRDQEALYSESADGGRTWSVPVPTKIASWWSPMHALRLADGRYLLTASRRHGNPGCIFACLGDRNGTPKSFEEAGEIVLNDKQKGADFGYATTAQNADGSLVTVYYAHPVDDKDAAVVYAVRWRLPD